MSVDPVLRRGFSTSRFSAIVSRFPGILVMNGYQMDKAGTTTI